ncbi:calmodulin-binding protein 60 B isoform X2 [Silene latifolia]|uniref:calmodulin-binding protein 60 B isoform X2 n=1 Tax=Silene latifolia TaxID=37657 RepID=UPI003D779A96
MQRQTRAMERSNSMRGKRSLDDSGSNGDGADEQPERKRPALASVIVEALKVDSLQKLCSSLEPILRRVVSEEVERALARLGPSRINGRASPKRIEGSDGRNLQLQFKSKLSLPLFTGGKVEGEQGATIHVVLIDATTGHVVTSGPESSIKLDVVVLEGDFNNEDDEDWSQEEFESHVVKEREGKRPLLTGELQVTLKEGVGTLGELTFTDNSSWIRSRKFRLGLKVAPGYCEGVRIREAKTEAFTVKDHRGELYKKHYPPALTDEVWRLEKIGKDGSFHKRLNTAGIYVVEDFLRLAVKDSQKLRNILGSGMSNRMWEALMEHAKTCVLSGKLYVYYSDDTRNVGVAFNNIYELSGLIAGDQYLTADTLTESQKVYVDTLVKKAYDNWHQVIEYDGKALINSKQTRRTRSSQNEVPMNSIGYPNAVMDNQLSLSRLPVPALAEQQLVENSVAAPPASGYNDNLAGRFANQSHHMNSNPQNQFDQTSFSQQELLGNTHHPLLPVSNNREGGLALGPPQPSSSGFQLMQPSQPPNINPYDDWSQNPFTEDDIRNRSHELLESDDMQQLLRIFSMGGHGTMPEDNFFIPTPSTYGNTYEEDRARPGKAVVGWLKIKAAMRWGFFIRKKAAERRAQLVELDD